jgi:hypothetical protein
MADSKDKVRESVKTEPVQTMIVWDDSNMKSVYSNISNVAGGREEIVLLFGMNQAWHTGQKEVKIQLSDRIVMSPFAAKRLAMLLEKVLQDYEKLYGSLELARVQAPPQSSMQ